MEVTTSPPPTEGTNRTLQRKRTSRQIRWTIGPPKPPASNSAKRAWSSDVPIRWRASTTRMPSDNRIASRVDVGRLVSLRTGLPKSQKECAWSQEKSASPACLSARRAARGRAPTRSPIVVDTASRLERRARSMHNVAGTVSAAKGYARRRHVTSLVRCRVARKVKCTKNRTPLGFPVCAVRPTARWYRETTNVVRSRAKSSLSMTSS